MARVEVQGTRLPPPSALPDLRCSYRLGEVTDGRDSGSVAGSLGINAFWFPGAVDVVRDRLQAGGFSQLATASVVSVQLLQLYVAQNLGTRVPVVVYRVAIDEQPPRVIRAQAPSMNWNATERDGYRAFSRALDEADRQLIETLNAGCPHDSKS